MFDDNGDPPGHYDVMNFQVMKIMMVRVMMMMITVMMMMITVMMMMMINDAMMTSKVMENSSMEYVSIGSWHNGTLALSRWCSILSTI